MPRSRTQTQLFSQLVNGRKFYRCRTRHEQDLAECFDEDDNFFQARANAVWYNISRENRHSRLSMLEEKYMRKSTDLVLYKMFKLDNTNQKLNSMKKSRNSQALAILSQLRTLNKIRKIVKTAFIAKMHEKYSNRTEENLAKKINHIKIKIQNNAQNELDKTRAGRIKAHRRDEKLAAIRIIKSEIKTARENPDMVCPITCFLMKDPVTTCNGFTYERTRYVNPREYFPQIFCRSSGLNFWQACQI
jgi:hypothetical protein